MEINKLKQDKKQNILKILTRLSNPDFYNGFIFNNTEIHQPLDKKEQGFKRIVKEEIEKTEIKEVNDIKDKIVTEFQNYLNENKRDLRKELPFWEVIMDSERIKGATKVLDRKTNRIKFGWMPLEAIENTEIKPSDLFFKTLNNQRWRYYNVLKEDAKLIDMEETIIKSTLNGKQTTKKITFIKLKQDELTWNKLFDFFYDNRENCGVGIQTVFDDFMKSEYANKVSPESREYYYLHKAITSKVTLYTIKEGMQKGTLSEEEAEKFEYNATYLIEKLRDIEDININFKYILNGGKRQSLKK